MKNNFLKIFVFGGVCFGLVLGGVGEVRGQEGTIPFNCNISSSITSVNGVPPESGSGCVKKEQISIFSDEMESKVKSVILNRIGECIPTLNYVDDVGVKKAVDYSEPIFAPIFSVSITDFENNYSQNGTVSVNILDPLRKIIYNDKVTFVWGIFCSPVEIIEDQSGVKSLNKLGTVSIPNLIGNVIKAVLGFVGVIALLMFLYAGILWMTAGGNSERQQKAKDILVWSTLGIIIILTSASLVSFVLQVF